MLIKPYSGHRVLKIPRLCSPCARSQRLLEPVCTDFTQTDADSDTLNRRIIQSIPGVEKLCQVRPTSPFSPADRPVREPV